MKKTRRMSRASQIAFAKAWLERQGIEAQTVDVAAHIDGSLSYEENLKNIKKQFKMGGRSKKKATRTMSAAECDVSIGNYHAGYNHGSMKQACECGDPDACDALKRKAKKAKPKSKAKKVSKVAKKKKAKAKPKKKACTVVKVKGYTRKCPTKRK